MSEADPKAAIRTLLARYIELFNAADFETALQECYYLPFSWLVGPAIDSVDTPAAFVARMAAMRAALGDQGLDHSELVACTVRMLGPDAGLAGVEVARHYKDGRKPEVTGGTYVAHNDGTGWRLTSLIGHPVADIVA
ncbi:MAG TPA: hypothetical protein VI199_14505 [Novosphingobium sp.]